MPHTYLQVHSPFPRWLWEMWWSHSGFGGLPATTGIKTSLRHVTQSCDSGGTRVLWGEATRGAEDFNEIGHYNNIGEIPLCTFILVVFCLQLRLNPDHHLVAKPFFYIFFKDFNHPKQVKPHQAFTHAETLKTTLAVGVWAPDPDCFPL